MMFAYMSILIIIAFQSKLNFTVNGNILQCDNYNSYDPHEK